MSEPGKPARDVYRPRTFTTIVGTILGLLSVILMILIMIWLTRPGPPPPPPTDPRPTADELRAADEQALTGYDWIDREAGLVRIPIDRAKELLIAQQAQDGTRTETD